VLEYGDYEWPACAAVSARYQRDSQHIRGLIALRFPQFPLLNVHPHAEGAAHAGNPSPRKVVFGDVRRVF
jgi:hypothetical protein